jgi:2-haloacid dehalogenase
MEVEFYGYDLTIVCQSAAPKGKSNTSVGKFDSFSNITRNSLRHALGESKLSLDDKEVEKLMKAYDSLSTFPDVAPALKALSSNPNITAVVFSNGTSAMVNASVKQSPDLLLHASIFKDIITVDEAKMFKPVRQVYWYLAKCMGKREEEMEDMWLVSGNPFDVTGARNAGMKAIWVDRAGNGWVDALVAREKGPSVVVKSLEEIPAVIEKHLR